MATGKASVKAFLTANTKNFQAAMAKASDSLGGIKGKLAGMGKVAAAGVAAGSAAIGAFAAKSVTSFMNFERGMSEVFTLLPGASEEATKAMTDDLQNFQSEFGVLSDKAIPALYDSLSAGVSQDNVFSFMADAQKLAVAGNVDTQASVDLLTTAMNSWGMDASEAARVSDVMFTTVKNGKTTIDQLGASLFNVAPIAGQLGVKVEDVGAAMAVLTAKGTPTSVATTQLRAGFAELSKGTTIAGKAFEKVAGKSFKEFMASGGDLSGVLRLMKQAAEESDVSVLELFGSIEAGGAFAAMAEDISLVDNQLKNMNDAAGASEEAFETMSNSMSFQWDRFKAKGEVALNKVGAKLAPFVRKIMDAFDRIDWDRIRAGVDRIKGALQKFAKSSAIKSIQKAIKRVREAFERFLDKIKENKKTFELVKKVAKVLAVVIGAILYVAIMGTLTVVEKFLDALTWLAGVVETVITKFSEWWNSFKLGKQIISDTISKLVSDFQAGIDRIKRFFSDVSDTISGWVDDFKKGVEVIKKFFSGIPDAIASMASSLKDKALGAFNAFNDAAIGKLSSFLSWISELPAHILFRIRDLGARLGGKAVQAFQEFQTASVNKFAGFLSWVSRIPGDVIYRIRNLGSAFVSKGRELIDGLWSGVKSSWGNLGDIGKSILVRIKIGLGSAKNMLLDIGRKVIDGFVTGLRNRFESVKNTLQELTGKVLQWKGPQEYDAVMLTATGENIIDGLNKGFINAFPQTRALLQGFTEDISSGINPTLNTDLTTLNGQPENQGGTVININIESVNGDSGVDLVEQIREELERVGV